MATHSSTLTWEIPCTEEPGWNQVHDQAGLWKLQAKMCDYKSRTWVFLVVYEPILKSVLRTVTGCSEPWQHSWTKYVIFQEGYLAASIYFWFWGHMLLLQGSGGLNILLFKSRRVWALESEVEAGSHLFTFAIRGLPPEAAMGGVQGGAVGTQRQPLKELTFPDTLFRVRTCICDRVWDSECCISGAEERDSFLPSFCCRPGF